MVHRRFYTLLFFMASLLLASCNRGYGCPTNLSEGLPWDQVGAFLPTLLTGLL